MLVWGGHDLLNRSASGTPIWFVNGARYRPSTDSWSPMASAGGPQYPMQALWTGADIFVLTWDNQLARYSAARDEWAPVSLDGLLEPRESPRLARFEATIAWTGTDLLIWATENDGADPGSPFQPNGFVLLARYDPAGNRWERLSVEGAPSPRSRPIVAWANEELLVWGGHPYGGRIVSARIDGARYNPITGSWTPMSNHGAAEGSEDYSRPSVSTGTQLVIWGSYSAASGNLPGGGIYDPSTDSWRSFPESNGPRPAEGDSIVWTGASLLLFGINGGWAFTPEQ